MEDKDFRLTERPTRVEDEKILTGREKRRLRRKKIRRDAKV